MKEAHIIFRGRVQGVCFRAAAKEVAMSLGLVGTVKNLPEGTVEAFVQGEESKITDFIRQLSSQYNLNNDAASVNFQKSLNSYSSFLIIH